MKLFYFTSDNLRNSFFIKEFVSAYYKVEGKAILVHAPFNSMHDTRFVTKRISSLLSDVLVVNNAISGDQKRILSLEGKENILVRKGELQRQLKMVDLLVMNTIAADDKEPIWINSLRLVQKLQEVFQVETPMLFTKNSKSPLAQEYVRINQAKDIESLLAVYEEERIALEHAAALAPSIIGSPNLFGNSLPISE